MANEDLQGDELDAHVVALQLLLGDKNRYTTRNVINTAFPNTYVIGIFEGTSDANSINLSTHLAAAIEDLDDLEALVFKGEQPMAFEVELGFEQLRVRINQIRAVMGYIP
jgi:hypothetical protein